MSDPKLPSRRERARGRNLFRIQPEFLAIALLAKCVVLFVYGVHATIVEVPTFVVVGGEIFALLWASVVAITSGTAAVGIVRTWVTGRYRFEQNATAAMVLAFVTYSGALLVRGLLLGDWEAAALTWLPIALSALPTVRYYSLVAR